MSAWTPLERAVLDALVWDLDDEIPDLSEQIAAARPGRRRNTGFGLFTETLGGSGSAAFSGGLSGDFGTVHAMVRPLAEPIAFKARLHDGVLIGLVGDSYGQDTRTIDFAAVPFEQLFTVDDQGRSIPFQPAERPRPLDAPRRAEPGASLRAPQPHERPSPTLEALRLGVGAAAAASIPAQEKTSLTVAVWVIAAAVSAIVAIVFDAGLISAVVAAFVIAGVLNSPKGHRVLRGLIAVWRALRQTSESGESATTQK